MIYNGTSMKYYGVICAGKINFLFEAFSSTGR